jgi:hypothetical protein
MPTYKVTSSHPPLTAVCTAYPTPPFRRSFTTNRAGRPSTRWLSPHGSGIELPAIYGRSLRQLGLAEMQV